MRAYGECGSTMRLEKVYFYGYGQWVEQEFRFAPGWNVIYAPDEWGKTALLNGMLTLLYGTKKQQETGRSYLDDYELYYPWTGSRYGGRIEYSLAGNRYCIERDLTSHFPQDLSRERPILEQQTGHSRESFEQATIIRSFMLTQERISPFEEIGRQKDNAIEQLHKTNQQKREKLQTLLNSEQKVWSEMELTSKRLNELEIRDHRNKNNVSRLSGSLCIFVIGLGLMPLHDLLGLVLAGIGAFTACGSAAQLVLQRQERVQGETESETMDKEKIKLYTKWVEPASIEEMSAAFEDLLEIQKLELERLREELALDLSFIRRPSRQLWQPTYLEEAGAALESEGGLALPLFLDDAHIQFDDGRLQRSLAYFDYLSKRHQLFYFTCSKSDVERLYKLGIQANWVQINEN